MKRRISSIVLVIAMLVSVFANSMCVVSANNTPNTSQIKNVIYMIPDGGGFALLDVANGVKEKGGFIEGTFPNNTKVEKGPMNLSQYLRGTTTTYSASSSVTDSAASGTALSSGYKTNNGYIGITPDGVPRANLLEGAQLMGKRTGLVATYPWHHATPAAFSAHNDSRYDETPLAEQIARQEIDVVMGMNSIEDSWDTMDEVARRGYTVTNNKADLQAVKSGDKIWGNNYGKSSKYDFNITVNDPTLAEMTDAAIRALDGSEEGFFLMVEGSKVDGGGHDNNTRMTTSEYLAFDAAFKVAVDYAKKRNDTVVIAVPDHDTGGLNLPGADSLGSSPDWTLYEDLVNEVRAGESSNTGVTWTTGGHTARNVGVWIYLPDGVNPPNGFATTPGYTAENKARVLDNTDLAPYLADLMGFDLDEATETLFVDVTDQGSYDEETATFTFDYTDTTISIKANYSTAMVNGEEVDLNGEVAVYSANRFYVPQRALSLRKSLDAKTTDTWYSDNLSGKVLIKGSVEEYNKNDIITLFMVKKGVTDETITKDDIGYIAQAPINPDGSYSFDFLFNGNTSEYEVSLLLGGKIVTGGITQAEASYSWLDAAVEIYDEGNSEVSGEVLIKNYADLDGLSYIIMLAFYDSYGRMIDHAKSDLKSIEEKMVNDSFASTLPEGTATVKAFVWYDLTTLVPLANAAILEK